MVEIVSYIVIRAALWMGPLFRRSRRGTKVVAQTSSQLSVCECSKSAASALSKWDVIQQEKWFSVIYYLGLIYVLSTELTGKLNVSPRIPLSVCSSSKPPTNG